MIPGGARTLVPQGAPATGGGGSGSGLADWSALGNLGATETLAGVASTVVRGEGTLNQNCTITVSLANNQQYELLVHQDGTGSRIVTWAGVDVWVDSAGAAPVLATAAGATDRLYFERIAGVTYGYFLTEAVIATAGSNNDLLVKDSTARTGNKFVTPTALDACRVFLNAAQNLPIGPQHTVISWDAEDYDDNNFHSLASNTWELIVPATGRYRVSACVEFAYDVDGGRQTTIWLNPTVTSGVASGGTRLAQSSCAPVLTNGVAARPPITTGQIQLSAGDKIVIAGYHDAGNALNANAGTGSTWACIERVK